MTKLNITLLTILSVSILIFLNCFSCSSTKSDLSDTEEDTIKSLRNALASIDKYSSDFQLLQTIEFGKDDRLKRYNEYGLHIPSE